MMTLPVNHLPQKPLFTSFDIEMIFDVKKSTVEQWRLRGCGPKFIRLDGSRLIRYRREDVLDFIDRQNYSDALGRRSQHQLMNHDGQPTAYGQALR